MDQLVCVAVLISVTKLPDYERPIRVGERFTTRAGVTFVIKSFKSMRMQKPPANKKK